MTSAWGEGKTQETMIGFSNTLLLFSILLRPPFCQGELMEKQRLKQDLLIVVLSVFMILLIFLIIGCIFLHFRLKNKDRVPNKEMRSYAIQTHCVKTKIVLSPSQTQQLAALKWKDAQAYSQLLPQPPSVVQQQGACQQPMAFQNPVAAERQASCAPLPTQDPSERSITHIYQSPSSESILSDEWGSIYSLDDFQSLCSSSWSDLRESSADRNFQEEEEGGSDESGSLVLCAVHQMR